MIQFETVIRFDSKKQSKSYILLFIIYFWKDISE